MSYATVEEVRACLQSDSEGDKQIEQMISDKDFDIDIILSSEKRRWLRTRHE